MRGTARRTALGLTAWAAAAACLAPAAPAQAASASPNDICWYKVTSERAPIRDRPDTNSRILGYYRKGDNFAGYCMWAKDTESGHWFVHTIHDGDNDNYSWVDYYHIN